jgi:hypothetical protein
MNRLSTSEMLPTPTPDLVEDECRKFDSDPWNISGEEALRLLREQFPENKQVPHVLLKVLVLNKLYSTRVNDVDVLPLAEHIVRLDLDTQLDQGMLAAVERIYTCDGLQMYYSFATKFCSWHNPEAYPIYDRYADECLWAYKKRDGFAEFQHQDEGYYEKFVAIVTAFRAHYGLDRFTFREIDKFLWSSGKAILDAKEVQQQG